VPLLLDHSCDPCLPGGALARVAESGLLLCQSIAARTARAITVATEDYADHSRFLRRLRTPRFIVPHAVRVPLPRPDRVARLRKLYAPNGEKLIGIAARRSAEKGLETLAAALPRVRHRFPDARVLHAGPPEGFGSRGWRQRIQAKIASLGEAWCSLGVLQPDLSAFFAACDVLVVPSLTRLESFGLVQVEAMLCGTPVVASDLPGVRVPVQHTGMGLLAPPGDASALANAVIEVLTHRERFLRPRSAIESEFSSEAHYTAYQRVLDYVGIHD
jgi:glycosyltransferase involved in cell wall biosynthesis